MIIGTMKRFWRILASKLQRSSDRSHEILLVLILKITLRTAWLDGGVTLTLSTTIIFGNKTVDVSDVVLAYSTWTMTDLNLFFFQTVKFAFELLSFIFSAAAISWNRLVLSHIYFIILVLIKRIKF